MPPGRPPLLDLGRPAGFRLDKWNQEGPRQPPVVRGRLPAGQLASVLPLRADGATLHGTTPPGANAGERAPDSARAPDAASFDQKVTPSGKANVSVSSHISLRVPQPGTTGAVSLDVSYSQLTRICEFESRIGGST